LNTPIPENAAFLGSWLTAGIDALFEPVRNELAEVQGLIAEQMQSPEEEINSCLRFLRQRPGKMLRPALLLLCGKTIEERLTTEHRDLAAMIELVHMASLLHDDVIDSADLRRGFPSANALWGNTAAVLLGDYLLCRAFSLGILCRLADAAKLLGQTAQTLCTGELKQNLLKGRPSLNEQDYLQIIESKTAVLFACGCRLGAMASGASEAQEKALKDFGLHFGMAFQIADDLQDILSTAAQTGKTQGIDRTQEKWTLPVIRWISQDGSDRQARINQWSSATDVRVLINQMRSDGSIDYAFQQARQEVQQAKQQLDSLPDTPARQSLKMLADHITEPIRTVLNS